MILYFLRHAEAVAEASSDFERALTDKGREQSRRAGDFCRDHDILPERLLTSPAVRARETAKIVARRLDVAKVEEAGFLAVGMQPEAGLRALGEYSEHHSMMLVGHEPDFSDMIAFLLGMRAGEALHLRKASLTAVNVSRFEPGRSTLEFLVPVRLMG